MSRMSRKNGVIALFALGLGLSSTAFANTHSINENCLKISIPELQTGPEVSLTALALRPGASNLNYVIYNKELPTQSPTWEEKEISPGYGAAFGLGARYVYPLGKDISLIWTHLNTSNSTSLAAGDDEHFLGPDYQIGPDGLPIRNAHGSARFKYDVINLDAGQFIDIGTQVQMRFFAGLSNVYLREQVNATYSGTVDTPPFAGPFSTEQQVKNNFTGIGPRIGIQGDYMTDSGFGVRANGAISALIGYSYTKASYTSSAVELQDTFNQAVNYQFINDKKIRQTIPGFDTKLALLYKHRFNNCMLMTLEGGYQVAVYVNAIQQYIPASLAQPLQTGGIFVDTMSHTQSNYSVQGPYLTAALQF